MTFHRFITSLVLAGSTIAPLSAKEKTAPPAYGFVKYEFCVANSLQGKKERENLEKQYNEINKILKDIETQIHETERKRTDLDYLDTLSPQAIDELTTLHSHQIEEFRMTQGKFSQMLQQLQQQSMHILQEQVKQASTKVALENQFDALLPAESTFFAREDLDVTAQVLKVMDENFIAESKQ